MLNNRVLLLNYDYQPLTICSAKRAIVMVWLGKAEVIVPNGGVVHSVSMSIEIPSVIRLLMYVKYKRSRRIQLSKQNVIRRDRRVCQYCGTTEGHMTVDHVVPKCRGGSDNWGNLVCACSSCNNKKGDRTPEQAGMGLLKKPEKPKYTVFHFARGRVSQAWKQFLHF